MIHWYSSTIIRGCGEKFEHVRLGWLGATMISNMVKANHNIVELILEHCEFGDEGAKAIASAISQSNATVSSINLISII